MSWVWKKDVERTEEIDHTDDPALAVNGLADFLPVQPAPETDSALAVSTLGDFFPDHVAETEDYFATASYAATTAAHDEEPAETPVEDDNLFESKQVFELDGIFQSDIQRAAQEFQLFAEKFHAFATECQQRVTI
jgi:hypothetical protein